VPIMAAGVIMDDIRYNLLQQSRAFQDLTIPIVIAFCGMVAVIALSAIFGFVADLGIDGIAMGYTIGLGLAAAALFLRWLSQCNTLITEADSEHQPLATHDSTQNSSCISSIFSFFGRSAQSVPPSEYLNRGDHSPERETRHIEGPYGVYA
jgi:hypothetical protein